MTRSPVPAPPEGGLSLDLSDEAATLRLGAALARWLRPGDWVLLCGPLGAGKSALARAIVRAVLAEPGREVPSPTYTLVNVHEPAPGGPGFAVWHADLYRLSDPGEAAELGLWEAAETALLLVEWPDRLGRDLPARHLAIALAPVAGGEGRHARLSPAGEGWEWLGRLAQGAR